MFLAEALMSAGASVMASAFRSEDDIEGWGVASEDVVILNPMTEDDFAALWPDWRCEFEGGG